MQGPCEYRQVATTGSGFWFLELFKERAEFESVPAIILMTVYIDGEGIPMNKTQAFDKIKICENEEDVTGKAGQINSLLYTIGDMAREFGVSVRALRFYEDRGLIHPARKGTVRYYDENDRRHLQLILKGKRLGFTLSEIHDMLQGHTVEHHQANLELVLMPEQIIAQISYLERQQNELEEALVALRLAHQKLTENACQLSAS